MEDPKVAVQLQLSRLALFRSLLMNTVLWSKHFEQNPRNMGILPSKIFLDEFCQKKVNIICRQVIRLKCHIS